MKALIPLVMIFGLILLAVPVLWIVSPQAELSGLREENIQLRERLAELKADTLPDVLVIVVAGMMGITVILLTGFFLLLCLLANKRPAEFFSVRQGYTAIPQTHGSERQALPEPERNENHYSIPDFYPVYTEGR